MKAVEILPRVIRSNEAVTARVESGYTLNIAGVYQDWVTQDWATQTCDWATQQARVGRIQKKWFNLDSLGDPEVLADAVRTAL